MWTFSSALRISVLDRIHSGKLDSCNIHISCRLTMHGNLQEIRYGHTTTSLSMLMLQLSGFGLLGIFHEKRNFVNLSNYINPYKKHQKKKIFQRCLQLFCLFPLSPLQPSSCLRAMFYFHAIFSFSRMELVSCKSSTIKLGMVSC